MRQVCGRNRTGKEVKEEIRKWEKSEQKAKAKNPKGRHARVFRH